MLNPTVLFYITLAVSVVLPRIPHIGKLFRILNTLVHETGHAIAGTFFLGDVRKITLENDTSGKAELSVKKGIATFFITLAGYTFPPVTAWIMFCLSMQQQADLAVLVILLIAIIDLLLYVRNPFGIIWLMLFIFISIIITGLQDRLVESLYPVFLAGMLISDNIADLVQLLIVSWNNAKQTGDARALSESTSIHPTIWIILFISFSIFMAYRSILCFPH